MTSRGPFCRESPEVCGFLHHTQTLAVDGILPGRRLGCRVPRGTQGRGGEKPGLESVACSLGGQAVRSACPGARRDCEVGRMGTPRVPWREGSRPLEGSGSFPQGEEQACRKEGPASGGQRGSEMKPGTAGHPLPAACWPLSRPSVPGRGWAGRARPTVGSTSVPSRPPSGPGCGELGGET